MSPVAVLLVLLILVALAGLVLTIVFAVFSYQRYQMLASPPAAIADLRPGFGKVKGAVAARGPLLVGPLSGRECVYYRFRVEEEQKTVQRKARPGRDVVTTRLVGTVHGQDIDTWTNQRSSWTWDRVVDEECGSRAVVQDRTGEAEVDLTSAAVEGGEAVRIEADAEAPPARAVQDMLRKKYRVWVVDREGRPKKIRIVEEVIAEGAKLTVAGPVRVEEDGLAVFEGGARVSDKGLKGLAKGVKDRAVVLAAVAGLLGVMILLLLVALVFLA
jgi:hypothetical protein